jgi:hypothetical protein
VSDASDWMAGEVCAVIENRCGIVRGIGPAVREALARVLGDDLARLDALREVAASAVTFEDPRVGYVEVQIDRATWLALQGGTP